MKTSVKVLVAAAVAAACSGPAMAYGPTVAPDFSFYVGGGSAQGGAFLAFAQSLMAADGNLDVYTDDATNCGQGANYRAVYGTWKTTAGGITAGKKVLIAYANNGGTFKNGIDGVARAHTIDHGNFVGTTGGVANSTHIAACTAALGAGVPSPFTATAQYALTAAAGTVLRVPDAGLSDEEMGLFSGVNIPTAAPNAPLTSADFSNTTRTALYENVFGVAINSKLSANLQSTFGNQTITSAQMTAILAGTYSDWSQICQINAGTQTCLAAGPITFISRSPGSGSKAAFNEYFLNNPGTTGFAGTNQPPVDQAGNTGDCTNFSNASYNVCDQSSNGNVKKALNKANTNSTQALGILGLEFQPVSTDSFSFASLDGVTIDGTTTKTCGNAFPNAFEPARVVNGDHRLYFTNSLNIRSKSVGGAHFLGDGSVNANFMTAFSAAAASPVLEVSVPGVLLDPAVVGGPAGNPYDACITKGTHNGDSTGPLLNQF